MSFLRAVVVAFVLGGLIAFLTGRDVLDWRPPAPTPTPTATVTPISTSVPTATPSPSPTQTPQKAISAVQVFHITYYGPCCEGGPVYCGTDIYGFFNSSDSTTIATGSSGYPCGTQLRVCSESACLVGVVKDRCEVCGSHTLDLSRAGWELLGRPNKAKVTPLPGGKEEHDMAEQCGCTISAAVTTGPQPLADLHITYCPLHKAARDTLRVLDKLTNSIKLVGGTIGESYFSVDADAKLEAIELLHELNQGGPGGEA